MTLSWFGLAWSWLVRGVRPGFCTSLLAASVGLLWDWLWGVANKSKPIIGSPSPSEAGDAGDAGDAGMRPTNPTWPTSFQKTPQPLKFCQFRDLMLGLDRFSGRAEVQYKKEMAEGVLQEHEMDQLWRATVTGQGIELGSREGDRKLQRIQFRNFRCCFVLCLCLLFSAASASARASALAHVRLRLGTKPQASDGPQ